MGGCRHHRADGAFVEEPPHCLRAEKALRNGRAEGLLPRLLRNKRRNTNDLDTAAARLPEASAAELLDLIASVFGAA